MKKDTTPIKKEASPPLYQAVGRRKTGIARVRLYVVTGKEIELKGTSYKGGDIVVNGKPAEAYFAGAVHKSHYLAPFQLTETLGRFFVSALITGGGLRGQIGAFILGVSRALEKVDKEKYRPILKKHGFLTRDAREKQRRMAGFAQKARAKKQSPKR